LLDTADAVARQAARLLAPPTDANHPALREALAPGALKLWSSGNAAHLAEVTHRWLGLQATCLEMPGT